MTFKALPRWCAALLGVAAFSGTAAVHATVVERVVAIVGEQAILLSDLRDRAKPFLLRVEQQSPDGAQRAAATSQLYGQLLQRLIEEELEQKAANRANLSVTPREIDDALQRVATQNSVTVDAVIEEATKSGLTEQSYRLELKRQLLEAKLMNLRIQGRIRVSEDDVRTSYDRLVSDERKQLGFRAAWIHIAAPRSLAPDAMKARRQEADAVVADARRGVDFGELARKYSEDSVTRDRNGVIGDLKPGQLPPAVDAVAQSLDVGAVSEPIRVGDDFVVLKLLRRDETQLPTFKDAHEELGQRVYMDKMSKARQHWIDGLKRQTHVEVRL